MTLSRYVEKKVWNRTKAGEKGAAIKGGGGLLGREVGKTRKGKKRGTPDCKGGKGVFLPKFCGEKGEENLERTGLGQEGGRKP